MNESITRAAGSSHGQEWSPRIMEAEIKSAGRTPRMRTTLYRDALDDRKSAALGALELIAVANEDAGKFQRGKRLKEQIFEPLRVVPSNSTPEQVVLIAACN